MWYKIKPTNYTTNERDDIQRKYSVILDLIKLFEKGKFLVMDSSLQQVPSLFNSLNTNNKNVQKAFHRRMEILDTIEDSVSEKVWYFENEETEGKFNFKNITGSVFPTVELTEEEIQDLNYNIYSKSTFEYDCESESTISRNGFMRMRSTDGFVYSCLEVYDVPNEVTDFWLNSLFSFENVIVEVNYQHIGIDTIAKNVSRTKLNAEKKWSDDTKNSQYRASAEMKNADYIFNKAVSNEELLLSISIKVHLKGLEQEVDELEDIIIKKMQLRQFKLQNVVGRRELANCYNSIVNCNSGEIVIFASTLSKAGFFEGKNIIDESSFFYGEFNNRIVALNKFVEKEGTTRKSFDAFVFGHKGFGKTTLLKKMMIDSVCLNENIVIYDYESDFLTLTENLGGIVINVAHDDYGFQLFDIVEINADNDVNISLSATKITTFFSMMIKLSEAEEVLLETILIEYYKSVTNKYSFNTFKDYLEKIEDEQNQETIIKVKNLCNNIIKNKSKNKIINSDQGRSVENQIINYHLKGLNDIDKKFCDAILVHIFSLEFAKQSKDKVTYTTNYLDECQRTLHTGSPVLRILTMYILQGRKYRIGNVFSTQTINNIVYNNAISKEISLIKTFLEESTYIFVSNQKTGTIQQYRQNLNFSESILSVIPTFRDFQFALLAGDDETIFNLYLDSFDRKMSTSEEERLKYEKK